MGDTPASTLVMPSLAEWLAAIGLTHLEAVLRDNGIAEDVVGSLTEADLVQLGLSMGDRKRMVRAIAEWQAHLDARTTTTTTPPSSLAEASVAVASRPATSHTELRQLTIMFCDLVDATALCARLTPEQWRQVVLAYQHAAVDVITRCGGVVAQYLGDGLLVYFGYPQAQEDAALRAVHAGLDLVKAISALDISVDGRETIQLRSRIGIDTGRVVIGDIGAGERREQLALGDTPNIAARLQGLAQPDTVVITEPTRRLTAGSFTYEDHGIHVLKGVSGPRQVWRVTGVNATASRFDATSGGRLSPLIGRVQELSLLTDRWQAASQGQGQVVLLSGEPGIGKSRMLTELRDRLGQAGLDALQFQCAAHRVHSAFHPVVDALERMLRLKPDMPAPAKLDRIDALVQTQLGLSARHAALMAALLAVPADGRFNLGVSAAHQREQELVNALADLLVARAAQSPLLVMFEDVHWADPASVVALGKMVECAKQWPMLLVVTHRPEFNASFDRQGHVTALKVPGLRKSEVAALVTRLMGDKALPSAIAEQIENRTDGVPLFVEELTKTLLDQAQGSGGTQAQAADGLPATLRDSLMARLERYAGAKEVAQVGAVIGREFSQDLLVALLPEDGLRQQGISALLEAGLAVQQEGEMGPGYAFKHALVQDTAYDSLLSTRKEALHATIVRTLESRYPHTVQAQPSLVARHAMAAGQAHAAIPYWRRASELALNRLALHEAVAHLQAGLHATSQLTTTPERDQTELQLQASLGTVHMLGKGWAAPEVEQAYSRASQLASAADKIDEAIWPLWGVCVYHQVRGEIKQAQAIGRRMVTVARQANSRVAWLVTNMLHTQLHYYSGQIQQVRGACEQVEHGYSDPQDRGLIALYSTDLKLVSMVHDLHAQWIMRQVDDVDGAYAEIEQRAAELDHPYSLAWAWTWGALVYLHADQPARLLPRLQQGLALAQEHGFAYVSAMATFALGWCQTRTGRPDEGIAQMESGLTAFKATGAGIVLPFFLALLGEALGRAGRKTEALECLARAWARTEQGGERWHEAELLRIRGELLLTGPDADPAQARMCFMQALAVAQTQGAQAWARRAELALAAMPN